MTLEDFFTLTEMKDGLTAPSRMQELVSVMQKEKDCVFKNASDATRQWAAVASTIAATDNKDCLDLFIQLDGLCFINRWLKNTQNFGIDSNDSFVEEAITAMLRAVEKLCVDNDKSISSGIQITVSNLLDHHSTRIRDRARVLLDSWRGGVNDDTESLDVELADVNIASDKIFREEGQPSFVNGADNDSGHESGLVASDKLLVRCSDNLPPETDKIASASMPNSDNTLQSSVSEENKDAKERSPNQPASVPSSVQEVAPTNEGLPSYTTGETTSVRTCNLSVPDPDSSDGQPHAVKLSDLSKKEKQEQNVNSTQEKLGELEICSSSSKLESDPVSLNAGEAKVQESVREPELEHNIENCEDGVCDKIITADCMRTPTSDRSGAGHNDCSSNSSQDTSVSGGNLRKDQVLEMSVSGTENIRAVKESNNHVYYDGEDASNGYDSCKPGKDFKISNIVTMKSSDDELDYGIVDALEVARQVALEVEREVCSSSDKVSEGKARLPDSPDSVRKEDGLTNIPPKEDSSRQSHSAGSYSEKSHASVSDIIEAEPGCRANVEFLQVTEAAQGSRGNSEKHTCAFDLNGVSSDDMDVSVNSTSAPIPVVSASRPAPTPGLPGGSLQFDGTLGWKGSAATSAFRPASPRKNCDSERNLSFDRNSDTSKQRLDWLDIDLNVAEGEVGMVKPIAESSGVPSGQSSVESPKRSSRLELDLNSTGDGDDGDAQPKGQRMEGQLFLGRNGYWSPSPASSSSSMQPLVRNIDLNDSPCIQTEVMDQGPCKSSHNAHGHFKSSDAPVISILGAKVEVDRKERVPQTSYFPNGKTIETAIDLTMSRAGGVLEIGPTVSYNHSSVLGYNVAASASTPPLSFSSGSPMYGGIPYMLNPRGAQVVPQVSGSYSQPPSIMSMNGTQLSLNGFGQSHSNFDLSAGFTIEGGNRDALAAQQFFYPGQGRTMEEHVRSIPQSSNSVVGGKRKEPDSGWESYSFSYKHPQPPWK